MENIFELVQEILSRVDKYLSEDNQLLKAKVYTDVMMMDEGLLSLLLSNERIKEEFFTKVKETLVFDKQKFAWLIESKEFLPDSYTRFSNKIGLTSDGNFISQKNDVVLDFPYKDCYLQGGQDKEDQKREEIFYHETIASDQVTRMLEPKVFTNAKRYTSEDVEEDITFDEKDNLIIKGNNLIALSSLLKCYEGKVKLEYIDPPYNTGNDGFKYNDNFNHSTWLTFMKNRLLLAKKLLRDDGFIFIEIDTNEMHYLKVLCDEIFGRENFINDIVWKRRGGSANPQNRLNNVTESILWYSKTENYNITHIFSLEDENTQKYINERFNNVDEKGRRFMKSPLQSPNYRENLIYEYRGYQPPKKGWSISRELMERWDKEGKLWFPENKDQNIVRKIYLDEYKGQPVSNLWTDIKVINPMAKERLDFDGQKPEALLKRLIELTTNEGDVVLDYHLGTGTTCATAHKMNRQYIGIEQMGYLETLTLKRLEGVIKGINIGISESVKWQGGGSFVYCELLENSIPLIDEIQEATETTINNIKEKVYKEERIVSFITREELKKVDNEFKELDLEDKKKALISLVDKNKLYVNLSDIDDETYNVDDSDKRFTESFYKREV